MELNGVPEWDDIQSSLDFFNEKGVIIDVSKLSDQFLNFKEFVSEKKKDNNWENLLAHKKWAEYFNRCNSSEVYLELLKTEQYTFSIFVHNGNVGRILLLTGNQWSNIRNEREISTVNSILLVNYNMNTDCKTFYNYLICNPVLLKKIGSNNKYVL
jgi:hypothetical protein